MVGKNTSYGPRLCLVIRSGAGSDAKQDSNGVDTVVEAFPKQDPNLKSSDYLGNSWRRTIIKT